jgi:prolyl-tRNA synthetase
VPIYKNDAERGPVMDAVSDFTKELKANGVRFHIDKREGMSPGAKYYEWEMRGVPLRVEIGPKDVEKNSAAVARRDVPGKAGKQFLPREGLVNAIKDLLVDIQATLLRQATEFRDANIHEVDGDYEQFKAVVADAWASSFFCGSEACEAKVKADNQAVSRCFPLEQTPTNGTCIVCGQPATERALFAKAY